MTLLFAVCLPAILRAGDYQLVAVNADRELITMKNDEGTTILVLEPNTTITLDGKPATIKDLQPGMTAKVMPASPGVNPTLDASSAPLPPEMALRNKAVEEEAPAPGDQSGDSGIFGSSQPIATTPQMPEGPLPGIYSNTDSNTPAGATPPAAQPSPTPAGIASRLVESRWSWPGTVNPQKLGWIRLRSDMTVRAGWHDWKDRGRWRIIDDNTVQLTVPTVNDVITLKLNADGSEATDLDDHSYHRLKG